MIQNEQSGWANVTFEKGDTGLKKTTWNYIMNKRIIINFNAALIFSDL